MRTRCETGDPLGNAQWLKDGITATDVGGSLPPMEHIIDWGWNEVAALGNARTFPRRKPCAERSGPSTPRTARTDRRYDGYIHFGFMLTRAEAIDGVWELARACIRNYLILRDKVTAFGSDQRRSPLSRRPWRPSST